jgi:uncharacterized membrane-anchored protein YhcB (DUF1043 family)
MPTLRATFGEALLRAHRALLGDLRALDEAVRLAAQESLADLRTHLETTRCHLTQHFAFEEQNGYLDSVLKLQPHLGRAVQHLLEEHRKLSASLGAIAAEAGSAPALSEGLREQVRAWVKQVRRHERRENSLVQDAFTIDLTAED